MPKAPKKSITPAKRVLEYPQSNFKLKTSKLWCETCFAYLDLKKSSIDQHLTTLIHMRNTKTAAEQMIGIGDTRCSVQEKFTRDVTLAFASADIPVHKLSNPVFRKCFEKYLNPCYNLPSVTSVRKALPNLHQMQFENLKDRLKNKKIAIFADETSDTKMRYVLNIMLMELDAFKETKPVLAATYFLDETNHATVSRSVIECIGKYGIEWDNIKAFVSDNVSYMLKCFRDILAPLFSNCHHVTCVTHILALVGDVFRIKLNLLNTFIANIKSIFSKAPLRKKRFLEYLRQSGAENPTLPPSPIIVRWNSWFRACMHHAKYFYFYQNFISMERLTLTDTEALYALDMVLENSVLKDEVLFVNENCQQLFFLLLEFEGDGVLATKTYTKLNSLYSLFASKIAPIIIGPQSKFDDLLSTCNLKLAKYIHEDGLPAIDLFKGIRILDPHYLKINDININEFFDNFKELKEVQDELSSYKVLVHDLNVNCDVLNFWKIHQIELPGLYDLAKHFLTFPVSLSSVERSFSKYNTLLSKRRHNLTEINLASLNFLYYNNNLKYKDNISTDDEIEEESSESFTSSDADEEDEESGSDQNISGVSEMS